MSAPPAPVDVLVVGGGPSGAACAYWLAEAGHDVVLLERKHYPREKTCGDGLIADSISALTALGLADEVSGRAYRTSRLLVVSPSGTEVRFETTFWVLPRLVLDVLLGQVIGYAHG